MSFPTCRRASLALLTTGLSGALLITLGGTPAGAAAITPTGPAAVQSDAGAALAARLGDRAAGVYVDGGRTVVAVNDEATAQEVRAAGAVARLVPHTAGQLAATEAGLAATAGLPGTAWAVDPVSNQVVVSFDDSVTGTRLAQVRAATAAAGDAARLEHVAGRFTPRSGGDAIYGGSSRCSLGFNVRSGTTYSFLTAGHCGNISSTWRVSSGLTGTTAGSSFPTNDYAIVRYNGGAAPAGDVNLYNGARQDIVSAGNATVGQSVKRSGSTTGVHSGTVQRLNATVNYGSGRIVGGLIQTNVCAEPGDSGGSLFAGTVALGLTSGGSGNCSSGGTTFFQPVTEALSVYGVSVY